jgi:hydroxymethylpyrimidine pyrophosphatase-like HAD family hydrolase
VSDRLTTTHARFDVILSDVDGCLVSEHTDALDLVRLTEVAEHNRLARERGDRPHLTLCTGRPQPFAECMTRLVDNLDLPIICENGVYLFYPREHVYVMDPAITAEHLAAVAEARGWIASTFAGDGLVPQPGKTASVSPYAADPSVLDPIMPRIREEAQKRGWPLRVSRSWNYINCDLEHISKATGIARFFEATGLKHDRAAGIGDTMGDLAIRGAVAWFACPANAEAELKKAADFVARGEVAEGVLEILRITSDQM